MEIDVREIRLGKWHVPKQGGTLETPGSYHTAGYFDTLEGYPAENEKGAPTDRERHLDSMKPPLLRAYEGSVRRKTELQECCFVQEIKAFTNVSSDMEKGFEKDRIESFWDGSELNLCMSMIHLQRDTMSDELVRRICNIFEGHDFLYYYTFDYSGIIILARGMSIKDYLDKLFRLNYEYETDEKHLVKDSFSVYGFKKERLKELFLAFGNPSNLEKENILQYLGDSNQYEITINISVQHYSLFQKFTEELRKFERQNSYQATLYHMLGRHDISIGNREADMMWFLYVQYLLDRFSNGKKQAFFAYESFIKNQSQIIYEDCSDAVEDDDCEKLKEIIEKIYESFRDCVEKHEEYRRYCIPVKEVCNSVISILNNGFATDFVLCMFQSFCELLQYLQGKIEEADQEKGDTFYCVDEFAGCFNAYLEGLNALINSTMHTDRQFIQATSFSAIFYDVPPKLMAFYVAMINQICNIIKSSSDRRYTFLMTPSFSDEIQCVIISYKEKKMPCDRILKVFINERSLYAPGIVIRRMAHEIAHFVGDDLRNREVRKEFLIQTYVYAVLRALLPVNLISDSDFEEMQDQIVQKIMCYRYFDVKERNYTDMLGKMFGPIHYTLNENWVKTDIRKYLKKNIPEMVKCGETDYLKKIIERNQETGKHFLDLKLDERKGEESPLLEIETKYLTELVMEDIHLAMDELLGKDKNPKEKCSILSSLKENEMISDSGASQAFGLNEQIRVYTKSLISLYKETFADLQMILLLGISYETYLKSFVCDEGMDVDDVENSNEDISRILVITQLMQTKGVWTRDCGDNPRVKKLHSKLCSLSDDKQRFFPLWHLQNRLLYSYLEKCMEDSVRHYEDPSRSKGRERLQKQVDIIEKYEDAAKVYKMISTVVDEYKKSLIEIFEQRSTR